jgi:dynein heavy chain
LINFTVTEAGLEDQLLSLVVKMERPDLAALDEEIIMQMNEFKIKLSELEKGLLKQLNEAEGDLTENIVLIESLEESKRTSTDIAAKVEIAKVTQAEIKVASENYRPSANRGALVFFLMNEVYKIHSFYKYSLDAFLIVVKRAISLVALKWDAEKKAAEGDGKEEGGEEGEEAPPEEEAAAEEGDEEKKNEMTPRTLARRVDDLTESITYEGFNFTRRGTLEDHKLTFTTMLTFRILIRQGKIK